MAPEQLEAPDAPPAEPVEPVEKKPMRVKSMVDMARSALEKRGEEATEDAIVQWVAEWQARAAQGQEKTGRAVARAVGRRSEPPIGQEGTEAPPVRRKRASAQAPKGWVIGGEPKRWSKVPDTLHRVLKDAGVTRGSTWQFVLWALGAAQRRGDTGRIIAEAAQIRTDTGLSTATIKRAKRDLVAIGFLVNHEHRPGVWRLYLALPEDLCKTESE